MKESILISQEMTSGQVNVTELIAALICEKPTIVEDPQCPGDCGRSVTLLVMTAEGIYAARDKYEEPRW